MNNKIEKLTLSKLVGLKNIVSDTIDWYTNELSTYGLHFNSKEYIENIASEREKILFNKRIKCRKLYDDILKLIEQKVEEYYD